MERCDGNAGGVRGLAHGRYDTVVRTCDGPQGRVRVINVCQSMERCDGDGGGVRACICRCDSCEKVCQCHGSYGRY